MRSYGDNCGIARALDLVGERWALLIVRELLLGPKRFTDLRAGLPNVGPDVLAQRLRELEATGIVTRRKLHPPAGARVYELTERGAELEPVILALGRFGSHLPPVDAELSPDSMVLALKTMFNADRLNGFSGTFELLLAENPYSVAVRDGSFEVTRGEVDDPDATVTAARPGALADALWRGRKAGVEISGDRSAARRFFGLFAAR